MPRQAGRAAPYSIAAALLLGLGFASAPTAQSRSGGQIPGGSVSPAESAGFKFAPVADAYVSSAKPQTNYGSTTKLKAEASPVLLTYLRFGGGNLDGQLTRATLWLFAVTGSNVGYKVYSVSDDSWQESSITYANAPLISSNPIGSAESYVSGTWTAVDVTSIVGATGRASLALRTSSTTALSLSSRESGSRSPVLVIETTFRDVTPPSEPTNAAVTAATGSSVSLSWTAANDNVGVAGYGVYQTGTLVDSTPHTSYTRSGLVCGTSYSIGVDAYDAAGNRSPATPLVVTTGACPDGTPPSVPGTLHTTSNSTTSITVSWSASTDNVGVTGYAMFRDGSQVATTSSLSSTFSGLVCGTTYTLGVEAFDGAGNRSARASLSAATSACGGGAPPFRFMINSDQGSQAAANYGYNLLDVGSGSQASGLPAGTQGLIWVGDYNNSSCSWEQSDATVRSKVEAALGNAKVFGYFFSDEPDPFACPTAYAQHRARSDFIHSIDPVHKTVLLIDANSAQQTLDQIPKWAGAADYFALDPYPCYHGESCKYAWIDQVIAAADSAGLNYWGVAQAFQDSVWRWPTVDELNRMLGQWAASRQSGMMTFAWTWDGNTLTDKPELLAALKSFNEAGSPPPPGGDTTAPSTPTGLAQTGATQTSVSLSWSAAGDNVGVTGYDVFRGGSLDGSSASTSYTAGGLGCGSSYSFTVRAKDAAGNVSAQSAPLSAATAACSGGADPVITAAGDICGSATDCDPTADLVEQINPARALTLGDNAYPDGSLSQFNSYYQPNWGRFKAKTSPAPGNHDYHLAGASGYFAYFGSLAPAEYYSYDIGSWHLISLNSEISVSSSSAQLTWLRSDLAAHPNRCVLAYWHKPRFSSGTTHGGSSSYDPIWQALYNARADVVLVGHEHNYERFGKQDPSGVADTNGIQQFVVGTGGASVGYSFGTPAANSQIRNNSTFGVLKLTLHPTSYDWQFVPIAGSTFTDSGSNNCS